MEAHASSPRRRSIFLPSCVFLAFSPSPSPSHTSFAALSLSAVSFLPVHCSFCRHMCGILNVWRSDHQLRDDDWREYRDDIMNVVGSFHHNEYKYLINNSNSLRPFLFSTTRWCPPHLLEDIVEGDNRTDGRRKRIAHSVTQVMALHSPFFISYK